MTVTSHSLQVLNVRLHDRTPRRVLPTLKGTRSERRRLTMSAQATVAIASEPEVLGLAIVFEQFSTSTLHDRPELRQIWTLAELPRQHENLQ